MWLLGPALRRSTKGYCYQVQQIRVTGLAGKERNMTSTYSSYVQVVHSMVVAVLCYLARTAVRVFMSL